MGASIVDMGRELHAVPLSIHLHNQWIPGSHAAHPHTLKLLLFNARSVKKQTNNTCDLIMSDYAELACITEIWLGGEGGVWLSRVMPTRI